MARWTKAVVGPGVYTTPDGTVGVPEARVRAWADAINAMVAEGYRPPVSWGHSAKAEPRPPADPYWESRLNAGYLESASVDASGRLVVVGNTPGVELDAEGNLVADVEAPSGERFKAAIAEVSIGARDWTDGRGKVWRDAPVHVALTPLPVWVPEGGQPPFEGAPQAGAAPVAFSTSRLVAYLATGGGMADEKKDDAGKEGGGGGVPPEGASGHTLKDALEHLAAYGISLPDDTTPENFLERLCVALFALKAGGAGQAPPAEPAPEAATETFMSTSGAGSDSPLVRALAARVEREDRERRLARIQSLAGRGLPAHVARTLRERATEVRFSVGADGATPRQPLDDTLDALEAALPGPSDLERVLLSTAREEVPPEGNEGEDRYRSVADEVARNAGLPARKKA